ncbi:hypothetical protein [Adhaeribacter radiodurans]|uniref:Uncharacterized protein n=1 Tax=Adhaeribacter radiodurans TaxID=2745197 RepID=A0A7L7L1Q4_9BACT|nr:hypothetical protein [Adhaeribacter radiodurans]QMU26718.1 hypothetical protein HUW48_01125 [Adhaeribacter radiodurans]
MKKVQASSVQEVLKGSLPLFPLRPIHLKENKLVVWIVDTFLSTILLSIVVSLMPGKRAPFTYCCC